MSSKLKFKPFQYQLSGHTPILSFSTNDGKLYKPFILEEALFYQRLSIDFPELISYLPTYYGVRCINHNNVIIYNNTLNNINKTMKNTKNTKKNTKINVNTNKGDSWAFFCFNKKFQKEGLHNYIVLKDLTCDFNFPIILELKLGTRQHGINESPEKIQRKMERCSRSTSKKLGVRVAGMMIHRDHDHPKLVINKYDGLQLNNETFFNCLVTYFTNNNNQILKDIIQKFIIKLIELKNILEKKKSLSLYSSSLLFIYESESNSNSSNDGNQNNNNKINKINEKKQGQNIELKMIDFARYTYFDNELDIKEQSSEYIKGINTIIEYFNKLL